MIKIVKNHKKFFSLAIAVVVLLTTATAFAATYNVQLPLYGVHTTLATGTCDGGAYAYHHITGTSKSPYNSGDIVVSWVDGYNQYGKWVPITSDYNLGIGDDANMYYSTTYNNVKLRGAWSYCNLTYWFVSGNVDFN